MCSLLCFGRKNSRGADLRDKTYTLCAPLKPCDLAPTPCGLFSCRASLSLAPPTPQTSQVVAGPSATSVKAGSATPLPLYSANAPPHRGPQWQPLCSADPTFPLKVGCDFPCTQRALFQGSYISSCR